MSETKFTKGPYEVGVSTIDGLGEVISVVTTSDKSCVVAACGKAGAHDEPESISNAYLFSAAPEMYEALEGARATISTLTMGSHPAIKLIDAVLSKAGIV